MSKEFVLIRFGLFGVAMWFFGNLYEAIAIAPNLLNDTIKKLELWDAFFTISDPVPYFVPLTHLAVLGIWFLAFNQKITGRSRSLIKKAALFLLLAELLTVVIVTQLNLHLFYGGDFSEKIVNRAILWNLLNAVRMILAGTALWYIFASNNSLLETVKK